MRRWRLLKVRPTSSAWAGGAMPKHPTRKHYRWPARSSRANQLRLAYALNGIAPAQLRLTLFAEAAAVLQEVRTILRPLHAANPGDTRARLQLILANERLGDIAGACHKPSLEKPLEAAA